MRAVLTHFHFFCTLSFTVNLLLLTWNFPPAVGGMETMMDHLFRGLRQRGNQIQTITTHGLVSEPEKDVHRAPRPGVPMYLLFAFCRGWNLCRKTRPDFILCGSILSAPAGWLLAVLFRVPWGVPLYGSDLLAGGRAYRQLVRFLLRRASRLFPISRFTRSLVEQLGVNTRRAVLIPPGVDVHPFEQEPTEGAEALLEHCANRRILLTAGRLVRRKGVLEFVRDAMPELIRRFPNLLFLVVGDDGAQSLIHKKEGMRQQIEDLIRRQELDHHVRLLGRLPDRDLIRLYFHADVFILPGLDLPGDVEGFGIVFSEAALAGVPAVATRTGGVPDAIEDGQTGLLVPPGDTPAIVEAVSSLLRNDEKRREMGQAAAQRARDTLAWEVIVGRYEQAIRDALPARN